MEHLLQHDDPENVTELVLDNHKISSLRNLADPPQDADYNPLLNYINLLSLSMNNCNLTSLQGFPHLPKLNKVSVIYIYIFFFHRFVPSFLMFAITALILRFWIIFTFSYVSYSFLYFPCHFYLLFNADFSGDFSFLFSFSSLLLYVAVSHG